jgi:menaquinone-dependent protoporphyrinogen oxidase
MPAPGSGRGTRSERIVPVVLGIAVITALAAGCAAVESRRIDRTYGEKTATSQSVLVAYGSLAGSTAEVADRIAVVLAKRGAAVAVKPVPDVRALDGYDAVVIGSAIRAGRVLPEVRDFVAANRTGLQRIPTAFFVVCMTLQDDTPASRRVVNAYLDPLRTDVTPVATGLFAGRLDYSRLGFFARIIAKWMASAPEGDYRDWPAIERWAEEITPLLIGR